MVDSLDQGIYLEDINTLIPWGASIDQLSKIANPVLQKSKDRIQLFWNDHIILGGIRTQIEATFYMDRTVLPHCNENGRLNVVSLNFYNTDNLDPREHYKRLKTDFIRTLGVPTFEGTASFSYLPFAEWDLPKVLVVLMVFERFGEYCTGKVWRKPLPGWRR